MPRPTRSERRDAIFSTYALFALMLATVVLGTIAR